MIAVRFFSVLVWISTLQLLSASSPVSESANAVAASSELAHQLTVVADVSDDDGLTDQICGTHPLKTIIRKIEHSQPDMDQQAVIRLLALMRLRAPKLWNSYQQMLAAYVNCKVMSAGGSLG